METLIVGALGGMLPLAVKFVVDRINESYRAEVGVAARRKERYQEEQASAIAGVYEKPSLYEDALRGLHLYEGRSLAPDQEERIRGAIGEADRVRRDFERYFAAHEIYFPEALASGVQRVSSILRQALWAHRERARAADVGGIEEARDAARGLLRDLKGRFRELLPGRGVETASARGVDDLEDRRPRIRRNRRRPGYRPARGRTGTTGESPAQ